MSAATAKREPRGIRLKAESASSYQNPDATDATGATPLNGKGKRGSTEAGSTVLPMLPRDDEADSLGEEIDPAATPPDDDLVTERPPEIGACPCWRVYLDWWKDGSSNHRPGVYFHGRDGTDDKRTDEWLCGPLVIEATTYDHRRESFGRLLRFRDSTGRWHDWNMPMEMLKGDCSELRGELLYMGLEIDPKARAKLPNYLMHRAPQRRVLAARSLGWHDGSFVLPGETLGAGDIRFQSESASPPEFEQRGTLDGWQSEVAERAVGNDILTLAISAAFAGPLLDLAHVEH
ncbi:MAG: DUF927 domain-containing protein, partial [Gammaproteobacteria bacterium]|nr:DUF927 domain-containing protein [Gammaproteobacteria bacterium]